MMRSGDVSGDWRGGGKGWINFGTTTNPLPITNMAPALFAVPTHPTHYRSKFETFGIQEQNKHNYLCFTHHNS